MTNSFVHLRNHTEYSVSDSLIRIDKLIAKAVEYKMPALAITDLNNLYGLVKFYKKCLSNKIKPITGCEVDILDDIEELNLNNTSRLVLLTQNQVGYKNLIKLISKSYLNRVNISNNKVLIKKSWLFDSSSENLSEGLIVLSAGLDGDIANLLLNNNIDNNKVKNILNNYLKVFNNRFYLEINRTNNEFNNIASLEEQYINLILPIAEELGIPVVATNKTVFLDKSDFEAHEARVCINQGDILSNPNRPKLYSSEQYFKSSDEIIQLFADIPSAIENTIEISKRCTVELELGKTYLPDFPTEDNLSVEQYLEKLSQEGLNKRLEIILAEKFSDKTNNDPNNNQNSNKKSEYIKKLNTRLQIELDVINKMGFPGYFLIVADFIDWAKNNGVPVGPGRGSGAGSLVAYALGITNLNPLDYDLLFERFLNPERVSMPDFDIDFCMDGRDRVIEYVANKYGKDAVSQIITFGTMAAKAVVRDVGRVLNHSYGYVDKIAKLIPFEIGMTLDKALEQEPQLANLYEEEDEVKEIIDLAKKLEGITRNVGKHAGGVVIAPGALTNFTAIYCEGSGSGIVSQFDKDDIETIGLVKFDFLGLRTLTIINWALQAINSNQYYLSQENFNKLDIDLIKIDDSRTFDLLKACKTTAVFQLESSGMKDLIKRLQPDCFEDIVALVALFRPGPLQSGMVDDFIDRKHGRSEIEYPHPDLEPILKPTYGVILYQEQVMQIAQVLAGYSLGAADLLRRAMGKKKPEEMAKQREIFVTGALKNNIEEKTATYIFDLMEKFAGYGFNKSHSAAYALVSYQTAYLKTHYKEAFMAAVLSSDMDNTDKIVNFYEDAISLNIKILKPDVNTCFYKFVCNDKLEILYGLGAIKGLGQAAIELIIAEREANGVYKDIFDFCLRLDLRKVNKRALEALIKSGAMDNLGYKQYSWQKNIELKNINFKKYINIIRTDLYNHIENAIKYSEQADKNAQSGQNDLFGFGSNSDDNINTDILANNISSTWDVNKIKAVSKWSLRELLQGERDTLGIFLSGHPLDEYKQELKQLSISSIKSLKAGRNHVVIAGVIIAIRRVKTRSGDRLFIVTLDDKQSRLDLVLFGSDAERYLELLKKDKVVVATGKVSEDQFTGGIRMQANVLMDMEQAKIAKTNAIRIILSKDLLEQQNNLLTTLSKTLEEYTPGNCKLFIEYKTDGGRAVILPDKKWKITLSQKLLDKLYSVISDGNIKLHYN